MKPLFDKQDTDLYQKFHIVNGYSCNSWSSLHRVIMQRIIGRGMVKSEQVDHINGNRMDNRRSNLRLSTHKENMMNRPSFSNSKSKYKNVYWSPKGKKKWKVSLRIDGKDRYFGSFFTEEEAATKANQILPAYHGNFARLNTISV